MTWVTEEGFTKRPLVVVEDHLYHMTELLARLGGPGSLYGQLTVVCLDRPGPDTTRAVAEWQASCPGLQVIAAVEPGTAGDEARFRPLPPAAFADANLLCQTLAAALRLGGMLLQDIQLATLSFIPADRWWESIYLASGVRGRFAERPPVCRFASNKRGYEATFGRDLLDAGFDPRDVIDKSDLARAVVPTLRGFLASAFPLTLRLTSPDRSPWEVRIARCEAEREEVERAVDLLLWSAGDGAIELGGRALPRDPARRRLAFKPGSQEAATWEALIGDRLAAGPGLPVLDVGSRLAPPDAGRPEITNAAARHLHTLRGRLEDGAAIRTAHHSYRLSERMTVGIAAPSTGARPSPET
jgi:hypothetical protein